MTTSSRCFITLGNGDNRLSSAADITQARSQGENHHVEKVTLTADAGTFHRVIFFLLLPCYLSLRHLHAPHYRSHSCARALARKLNRTGVSLLTADNAGVPFVK